MKFIKRRWGDNSHKRKKSNYLYQFATSSIVPLLIPWALSVGLDDLSISLHKSWNFLPTFPHSPAHELDYDDDDKY